MPYGDEQWHPGGSQVQSSALPSSKVGTESWMHWTCLTDVPHNVHNITTTNADSDDKLVRRMSGQIEENLADLTVNTS